MQEIQLDHPDTAAVGGGAITPIDRIQPIIGPICELPYLPPGGCIPPYETLPFDPPIQCMQ